MRRKYRRNRAYCDPATPRGPPGYTSLIATLLRTILGALPNLFPPAVAPVVPPPPLRWYR